MWSLVLLLLAQPANPWLEEARARSEALDFSGAIERLEIARQVTGLEPSQRREVLALLARCLVAEGQRARAEAVWTELLNAEPGYELDQPSTSPKILESFEGAKRRLFPADWVRLEQTEATPGRASFRLIDPWHQVTGVQRFERLDGGPWHSVEVEVKAGELSFPLLRLAGARLEWYLEVRAGEQVVARSAEEGAAHVVTGPPLSAPPLPDAPRSQLRPIAGWVLLGVGVLAAGLGGYLQVTGWQLRLAARAPDRPPGDAAATARAAEAEGLSRTQWATGLFIGGGAAGLAGGGVLLW